jgi:interferon-induced transmembrane protein
MHPGYQQPGPPRMDNNMGMAIVALVLFWPLGLPAILSSSKVQPSLDRGDYYGAQKALADSKKWSKYALIATGVWFGLGALCCLGQLIAGGGLFFGSTFNSSLG